MSNSLAHNYKILITSINEDQISVLFPKNIFSGIEEESIVYTSLSDTIIIDGDDGFMEYPCPKWQHIFYVTHHIYEVLLEKDMSIYLLQADIVKLFNLTEEEKLKNTKLWQEYANYVNAQPVTAEYEEMFDEFFSKTIID